jgi:chromosome segregation ATPase
MSSKSKKTQSNSSKSISIDVQGKLNEFYKVAKEKLTLVKNDLETSKKEYLLQKEINRKKELEYNKLLNQSKELDIKIKGVNEKIISAKRTENFLRNQIELTKAEISNANSEIDHLKVETSTKVKRVKDENDKINSVKENQLNFIKERLDKEQNINNELKERIKDAEKRIKELTGKIDKTAIAENKKNYQLLDELAEMNKFLSEL